MRLVDSDATKMDDSTRPARKTASVACDVMPSRATFELQTQRLQRAYANPKRTLDVETQISFAGYQAQTTIYHMDVFFRSTQNKWRISKRYSEFYSTRAMLKTCLRHCKRGFDGDLPLAITALEEALRAPFPRRHLRGDTVAIIDERKPALEKFVQLLVKVIALIPMSCSDPWDPVLSAGMVDRPEPSTPHGVSLSFLYMLLREFLHYPDTQIENDAKLKLAVLSLEDVEVHSSSDIVNADADSSECCSICLSDWDDADCAGLNVVKLPCMHTFHEECLMEWMEANVHCPMCREEPSGVPFVSMEARYKARAAATARVLSANSSSIRMLARSMERDANTTAS